MINRRVSASIALLVPLLIVTSCATVRDDTYRSRHSFNQIDWSYKTSGSGKIAHGEWVAFHQDGEWAEQRLYDDGHLIGKYAVRYPGGQVRIAGQFDEEGQATGSWTSYFSNGQIRSRGDYFNGVRNGEWSFWDEEGVEHTRVEYRSEGFERTFLVPERQFPDGVDPMEPNDELFCSQEDVNTEISTLIAELGRCFDAPPSSGSLDFQVKVGRRGQALSPKILGDAFEPRTRDCVAELLDKLQFRPPVGGTCLVNGEISTLVSVVEVGPKN